MGKVSWIRSRNVNFDRTMYNKKTSRCTTDYTVRRFEVSGSLSVTRKIPKRKSLRVEEETIEILKVGVSKGEEVKEKTIKKDIKKKREISAPE